MTWHRRSPLLQEGVVPLDLCAALMDHATNETPRRRSFQGVVDSSLRDSAYVRVPVPLEEAVLSHCAAPIHGHFGVRPRSIPGQPAVIYRYGVGVGFVAHHDEVTEIERARARTNGQPVVGGDLTMVVWLNSPDAYGGGELFFEHPPREFKPPCGSLVAFPATRDHVHGVRPIVRGERCTLVIRTHVGDASG
ncbi:2OG-Fe(II) oxygenase [Streptomyces sp. NPDC046203]|uniref:2OG-Fe(II) oxygenase n=1 Tax=Streptomyces sp. NPDC046203 TaxID=3154602 RepID=UPI0033C19C30